MLHYYTIGQGKPLVVVHGGPGLDHGYLLPGMQRLAVDHQVIFYDQRGSGKSLMHVSHKTLSTEVFVEDLEKIRQSLDLDKIIVLGHSWGGLLAMLYALKYPCHLSSLILINSLPSTSKEFEEFTKERFKRIKKFSKTLEKIQVSREFAQGNPKVVTEYYRTLFKTYLFDENNIEKLTLCFTPESALSGFRVHQVFNKTFFHEHYDITKDLKSLNVPTLVIHGDHDPIPVKAAQKIAHSIPHSQFVLIKNCGHFPYIEKPEELFDAIQHFLG